MLMLIIILILNTLIVNNVANFTGIVQFDNEVNFTNSQSVNINKIKGS